LWLTNGAHAKRKKGQDCNSHQLMLHSASSFASEHSSKKGSQEVETGFGLRADGIGQPAGRSPVRAGRRLSPSGEEPGTGGDVTLPCRGGRLPRAYEWFPRAIAPAVPATPPAVRTTPPRVPPTRTAVPATLTCIRASPPATRSYACASHSYVCTSRSYACASHSNMRTSHSFLRTQGRRPGGGGRAPGLAPGAYACVLSGLGMLVGLLPGAEAPGFIPVPLRGVKG
jgi:hypothetical protein